MPDDTGGKDALSQGLRDLRLAAGPDGTELYQRDAAALSGVSQPMISKIEKGHRVPQPKTVKALCTAYRADPEVTERLVAMAEDLRPERRRLVVSRDWAAAQKRIGRIEAASAHVRGFSAIMPPGLFQSEATVRAMFGDNPGGQARLDNQAAMLGDATRRVECILTEGSLGGTNLPPAQAAEAIEHVLGLTRLPNVRVGIIPWGTPLTAIPVANWESYDDRAVLVSDMNGAQTVTDPRAVATYLDAYRVLAGLAAWGDDARSLLELAADRYRAMVRPA